MNLPEEILPKMLVVDDDFFCRKLIGKIFEGSYQLLEAVNGAEALTLLEAEYEKTDVILLDLIMPVMGGIEFLRAFRKTLIFPEIPVIVITSDFDLELKSRLLAEGATDYFRKPLKPDLLRQRVSNVVSAYHASRLLEKSKALLRQGKRFRSLVEHSGTSIIEYDYELHRLYIDPYINNHFSSLDGESLSSVIAALKKLAFAPDREKFAKVMTQAERQKLLRSCCELRFFTKRQSYEWFRVTVSVFVNEKNEKQYMMLSLQSVNDEVINRQKLEYLAGRDQLTGLLNKNGFDEEVRRALAEYPLRGFVLARVDIERFHIVNQLFGTAQGDDMLKFFAVRLQEASGLLTPSACCRLGADQFAVFLPREGNVIEKMLQQLQASLKKYPLDYEITCACGIYYIDDKKLSVHLMLDRAQLAQKTVKGLYDRHYAVYDKAIMQKEAENQFILNSMEKAIEEKEFVIFLQPKVKTTDGSLAGAEALVRWKHPEKGLIVPGHFIPVFESNGFISRLDLHVWEEACRLLRRWIDADLPVVPVSVNVSLVDVYNPRLSEIISDLVDSYGLPHEYIEFELTESSFRADFRLLTEFTEAMHSRGFRVLMDDFGSGFSSLNTLQDIYVDVLKLDMRFITSSVFNERGLSIVRHIILMAKSLQIPVVAEGVETEMQRSRLSDLGCDFAQGYLFSKPLPVADFEEHWLPQSVNL